MRILLAVTGAIVVLFSSALAAPITFDLKFRDSATGDVVGTGQVVVDPTVVVDLNPLCQDCAISNRVVPLFTPVQDIWFTIGRDDFSIFSFVNTAVTFSPDRKIDGICTSDRVTPRSCQGLNDEFFFEGSTFTAAIGDGFPTQNIIILDFFGDQSKFSRFFYFDILDNTISYDGFIEVTSVPLPGAAFLFLAGAALLFRQQLRRAAPVIGAFSTKSRRKGA